MPRRFLAVVGLLLSFLPSVYSQHPPVSLRTQILTGNNHMLTDPDSLAAEAGPRSYRSPAFATVLSALVPGAGQIYAERYWTVPLVWGFGYWFVRNYIQLDRKYDEWGNTYRQALDQGTVPPLELNYYKSLRDFYRDERDRFAFYLAITYVLNMVDAYVGASLYNFDVSDDLGNGETVSMELRMPIR